MDWSSGTRHTPIDNQKQEHDERTPPRVLIASHLDTVHGTPGALDNASGVAVMFGVTELLGQRDCSLTIEFVPFNGEDHCTPPGEVANLDTYPDVSDIRLVIDVDGAGFVDGANVDPPELLDLELLTETARVVTEVTRMLDSQAQTSATRYVRPTGLTPHRMRRPPPRP